MPASTEATPAHLAEAEEERTRPEPEPVDYATLNAAYGAVLAGLLLATRKRAGTADPIRGGEILPIGAATFALAKVISQEKIGTWLREPFTQDSRDDPRPSGGRLRRAVGELVTCSRCAGAWSALGVVGLRMASPPAGRTVTAILASSATNDFLQAGFTWLCEKTNKEAAEGD